MRWLLLITLFFTTLNVKAQNDFFNSDNFWHNIVKDQGINKHAIAASDTLIIVASNRTLANDKVRFMSEVSNNDCIHYMIVYASENKWHVLQVANLSAAIQYIHNKDLDWVIYTEGMGKIFTSDIDRGMRMAGTYKVNVLLLDYPSARTRYYTFHNYLFSIHNARIAYKNFVPVLDSMKELETRHELGNGHLTLFFHSMGNNVMMEIVKHKKLLLLNNTIWADNLILNAPCVPQKHHRRWVDQIDFAKRVYVTYNPNDHTLQGAHLVSFKKQLGEKVRRPISSNDNYINFDRIAGKQTQ